MMKQYIKTDNYDNITQDNICDCCIADEDECGEYRECCHKDLKGEKEDE